MVSEATAIPNMPLCSSIQAHSTVTHSDTELPGKLLPLWHKEWWSPYSYFFLNYLQILFSTSVKHKTDPRSSTNNAKRPIAGLCGLTSKVRARHRLFYNHRNFWSPAWAVSSHSAKNTPWHKTSKKSSPSKFSQVSTDNRRIQVTACACQLQVSFQPLQKLQADSNL